jgi:hypothetical protein
MFDVLPIKSILGEDTTAKLPVLGSLTGSRTDEYKALIKKQEQMAREAAAQRKAQHQQGLQSLGQSLAAFGPRNQMMAQMFGPEAAFTPQQIGAMSADPAGPPKPPMVKPGGEGGGGFNPGQMLADAAGLGAGPEGDGRVSVAGYTGTDPTIQKEVEKYLRELAEWKEQEARRRQMVEQSIGPRGPGPAPIKMPRPMAGRR